jgi:hypothetical protein
LIYIRDELSSSFSVADIDGLDIMQVFDEAIVSDTRHAIAAEAMRAGHEQEKSYAAVDRHLLQGKIEWSAEPDAERGKQWTLKDGERPDLQL